MARAQQTIGFSDSFSKVFKSHLVLSGELSANNLDGLNSKTFKLIHELFSERNPNF